MAPPNLQITLGHPHERAGDIMASGKKATLLVANPCETSKLAALPSLVSLVATLAQPSCVGQLSGGRPDGGHHQSTAVWALAVCQRQAEWGWWHWHSEGALCTHRREPACLSALAPWSLPTAKRGCVAWLAWRNPPDGFNSAQQFLQACQAELHSVPWQVCGTAACCAVAGPAQAWGRGASLERLSCITDHCRAHSWRRSVWSHRCWHPGSASLLPPAPSPPICASCPLTPPGR